MKNVLVDMFIDPAGMRKLESIRGISIATIEGEVEKRRSLPAEVLKDKDILFCCYPPDNFDDLGELEFVQIYSAGYTQVTGLGLPEKNIRACNARGVFDTPIAEWNVAMMVNLARDLRSLIRNQDKGLWDRSACFQHEIRGSTVGIWGYGGIGRETARVSKALGLTVHVLELSGVGPQGDVYVVPGAGDPNGELPDRVFTRDQEQEFLAGLDFLILSMPLTKQTEGIVGARELQALPRTAYVLNPARGPLIQEDALLQALRENWIAGAALDTHYHYPMPTDHPLWQFSNVIMTPHISGSSQSPNFCRRIWDIFCQNVERFLCGQPLLNELTAEQLDGE